LDVVLDGNVIEDSERGGMFGVTHGGLCKSNRGRVYMTLTLKGNTVRWSEPFLSRLSRGGPKHPAAGITLGYLPSIDPGELVVTAQGNRLDAPGSAATAPALKVNGAWLNGAATVGRSLPLGDRPPAATGLGGATPPEGRPVR
jgi:hypothetical protein